MSESKYSIRYETARFLKSAQTVAQCPEDTGFEVAFAGRSNAGKSSAINSLTQQKKLCRTSKTPGRTRLINLFSLDDERRLVDLPGYGYAKVSRSTKEQWQEDLQGYLEVRECLKGLILVSDIRHPLQPQDQALFDWSVAGGIPVHILLTKADKLKFGPAKQTLLTIEKQIAPWGELASAQLFSSLKKTGLTELKEVLNHWFNAPAL